MGQLMIIDLSPFMQQWMTDYGGIYSILPINRILELSMGTEVFHLQDYMGEYPAYNEYYARLESMQLTSNIDIDYLTGFFVGIQEQLHLFIVRYIGAAAQYYFERWLSPTDVIIRVI